MFLQLDKLRQDGGTQARVKLEPTIVREYADLLTDPAFNLPKITAFFDGEYYWLADGFYRSSAYRLAGRKEIEAEVIQGTQRDAILYSVSANETHGLRRTYADRENAVKMLLNDKEWVKASDRWIADACKVSPTFVGKIRKSMPIPEQQTRKGMNGRTYTVPQSPPRQEQRQTEPPPQEVTPFDPEPEPEDSLPTESFSDPPPVDYRPIQEPTQPPSSEPERPKASTGVFAPLPRNGSIIYDDKLIDSLIGKLMREIDNRGNAIAKSPAYQRCVEAMNSVEEAWQWWRKK